MCGGEFCRQVVSLFLVFVVSLLSAGSVLAVPCAFLSSLLFCLLFCLGGFGCGLVGVLFAFPVLLYLFLRALFSRSLLSVLSPLLVCLLVYCAVS